MLIIDVKDNESIDRALKRYKRKHRDAKVMQQIRARQHYTKPSIERRNQLLKAAYKLRKQQEVD
ncbi:30S ribosomal protein S21 [Flavilitoribacter nigricans]|uniref:Small ribosomal subunit protein bS21 n=1 Tax=Flavilitoribacter nigricans (strain ATCC 23147 / DSM 23189 / NBRC 102662 / NCIMB 1420 / SS-2) TaxID=1122177 RepID=A0A2D0N8Y0_FLAN2|nr:30S ribosomal protein S21 [Flavilitoribacter nigricans]PHN04848.1 30S ribosomal protein S21 [Flavilitoribacter nigricans DSM 23189 = NBRC 102662]